MKPGRGAVAGMLGLLLAAVPGVLRAQQPAAVKPATGAALAARLEYGRDEAAARCPDAAALQDAVSRQLGAPVFEREPPTHLVRVQIAGVRPRGLRAQIEVRSATGEPLGAREIDSRSQDCAELSSALALAIAIALDPTRLFAPSAPPPESVAPAVCPAPVVCPVCPPVSSAAPPPPAAPSNAESSFRGIALAAGLGAGIGALPAVSGAGVLEVSARFAHLSAGLAAVLHPGASGGELEGSSANDPVEGQLLLGQLALCGRLPLDPAWTFAACALGSGGALRGSGTASDERDASPAVSVGAQARLERALTDALFLEARAELQANLVRTTLNVGDQPVWTTPPVWGQASLLAGLRFP